MRWYSYPWVTRLFWTHRGAARWAADRNPFPHGTPESLRWRHLFWRDQAERGMARAEGLAALAVFCAVVSCVVFILRAIA